MKRKIRMAFGGFVFLMFVCLLCKPVLADTTTYQVTEYRIPWGNGVDDNNDGVIDDMDELDVQFGNVSVNVTDNLITDTWNMTYDGHWGHTFDMRDGVKISGLHEELWLIQSSYNSSMQSLVTDTCKYYDNELLPLQDKTYMMPAIQFYVNVSPSDIMTGCQDFWYRSPLAWNFTLYEEEGPGSNKDTPHWMLNIYDDDDNLVYVSSDWSNNSNGMVNHYRKDASVQGTDYYRLYSRIQMNFRTEEKYRFVEYIQTENNDAINNIAIFMCRAQDIADDELTATYLFPGKQGARMIPVECSWGMLCTTGIGNAGTEVLIESFQNVSHAAPSIIPQNITGTENDVDAVTIIIPMRTSMPQNVTIYFECKSGATENDVTKNYYGATGTIVVTFNITDGDAGEINWYYMQITFGSMRKHEGEFLTYYQNPSIKSNEAEHHTLTNYEGQGSVHSVRHFAMHIEVIEHTSRAVYGDGDNSPDEDMFLLGTGIFALGLFLTSTVILAEVGIPLMVAGTIVGSLAMLYGGMMTIYSFSGDGTISGFHDWFGSQLPRAGQELIEGITTLWGGLQDVFVRVVEAIVNVGEILFEHGADILSAFVDIIYLLTFFAVIWVTQRFLAILTALADNKPEDAFKQVIKLEGGIKQVTGRVLQPRKYVRGLIRPKGKGRTIKYKRKR